MKRFANLLVTMVLSGLLIGLGTFWTLYDTAFEQMGHQLVTTVESQKAIITSMEEFDEIESSDFDGGSRAAILLQIENAYRNFKSFGETGEFTVAEKSGDRINFIFRQRHSTLVKPAPTPFKSQLAEPMRRALSGASGIIVAEDYRGEMVLAAFTPVENLNIGIVAKIDLSEVREPFFNAAIIAIILGSLVYSIGAVIFMKFTAPIDKEIKNSEKLYRNLIQGGSHLICRTDMDGIILFANEAYLSYFGVTSNELIGTNFLNLIPKADQKKTMEEISKLSSSNKSQTHQHKVISSTGEHRWVQWTNTLISGPVDGSEEIISAGLDITEKKLAVEKLHSNEIQMAKLGRAVERAKNEIFTFDSKTLKFETVNNCAQLNLGYSMEELRNLTPFDIKPEFSEQKFREYVKPLLDGEVDKLEFETIHERKDKTQYNVAIHLSISDEMDHVVFFAVIRDITERTLTNEKLTNALEGTVKAISLATEARDPYTAGHQRRVSDIAVSIAQEMGLDEYTIRGILWGSLIHDIGKISTPAEILSKPTKLTEDEFNLIKAHPKTGYDILKDIDFPWPIAEMAYQHHERINGTGYPQGLKGDDICLEARIVAVADVLEAITSHRPYRPSRGIDVALKEIKDNRGELYDPEVVDACLKLVKEKKLTLSP